MTDSTSRMLETLFDRIARETNGFEKREADKPFLPTDKEHFKQNEFEQYCLDIERLLGCDPDTLGLGSIGGPRSTLYHSNWMFIPNAGLFLDSDDSFLPLPLRDGRRHWQRTAVLDRLREIELAVSQPGGGTMSRPSSLGGATPIQLELPCLLILYVAGPSDPPSGRFYSVTFNTLRDSGVSNAPAIQALSDIVRAGNDKGFYALHYAGFPTEDRLRSMPASALAILDGVRDQLNADTHPLFTDRHRRRFLEAVTLHFQRQWGDREAQLLLREHAQSDVAHELCHDLYDALTLLKNSRAELLPVANSEQLRSITAAIEAVRSCFATPWLLRLRRKEVVREPIWTEMRAPAQDEIEAVFALFDKKLQIICNGARPLQRHVRVTRWHLVDGQPFGEPDIIDLGDGPDDLAATQDDGLMPPVLWPCGYSKEATLFNREGNRSLLFSPQAELLRNAVREAAKADARAERLGIEVRIDIASDGSRITGSVRNGLNFGHAMSGADRKIAAKIELMSYGLKARFAERNGYFEANWELSLKQG